MNQLDDETKGTIITIIGFILLLIHPLLALGATIAFFLYVIYVSRNFLSTVNDKPKRSIPEVNPVDIERILNSNQLMSDKEKVDYLKSPKWKSLRWKVFERDNYKCVTCGYTEHLNCHHITYKRLGDEKLEDLTTLCVKCHHKLHKELGYDRFGNYVPKSYIDYLIEEQL